MGHVEEAWKTLKRYKHSIVSALMITGGLCASIVIFRRLDPLIAAIGGLLFSIPIRFFWESHMTPILRIKEEPEIRRFHLGEEITGRWGYDSNRILVENTGRRAAKNCKGYIVIKNSKERVCWTVPKERPNATINAMDEEKLDFCAFLKDGPHGGPIGAGDGLKPPRIISPTEECWPNNPTKCRPLMKIEECEVLVTADNAEPVRAGIRIDIEKERIYIRDI